MSLSESSTVFELSSTKGAQLPQPEMRSVKKHIAQFLMKQINKKHSRKQICKKHFVQKHLQKGVFRQLCASGGCHDLRCERRGSEEARRPWLYHLACPPTPSFISRFLRLRPKQKLTAPRPWPRCCIMVDGPISGAERRNKSGREAVLVSPNIWPKESASLN